MKFQVLSLGGRYIYLLGGALSSDQIHTQSSTWRYDGATGQWTKCAAMLEARSDFAAVAIGNRFILVAGEWARMEGLWAVLSSPQKVWTPVHSGAGYQLPVPGC